MTEKKTKNNTKNNTSSSGLTRRSSITPILSSSCLTRGSRNKDIHSTGFPVKRGMTKDLESGRSMTEMLGVLAIVGVLSVGGIAGYTYAMNKHYANELLGGASERSVFVSTQIVAGLEPSLKEFADIETAGGVFSAEVRACTEDCQNCYYEEDWNEICEDTIGCSQNDDCDDWCEMNGGGEECYCAINADYLENDSACYNNFRGRCAVATPKSAIKGGYMASSEDMTWWSALNFCKAHGKSLISLADLGITGGYQDDARCGGSECTGTFTWSDLQDKLGYDYYWTTDAVSCDFDTWECTSGTNNNSCFVFGFTLRFGRVYGYRGRASSAGGSALCR